MKRRVGALCAALPLLPSCLLPSLLTASSAAADLGGAPVTARQLADEDPLEVTLQSLTPSAIPRRGPIELSGTVVNQSDETWTDLKIYPWRSTTPITTVAELQLAAATDPALGVGTRIIETYAEVDEVEPGGTAGYHLTVPRAQLGIENDATGVYWIGVQVLATSEEGRDEFTDGRVRTFVPLMRGTGAGQPRPVVPAALVVPIRHDVIYARNGTLRDLAGWTKALEPGGQLRNVVQFLDRAQAGTITLVVDPAVLEAIRRIANGNPARDLGPADEGPEPTETPSPTETSRGAGTLSREIDTAARWAGEWLDVFTRAADHVTVLALPYADLDVDAAAMLDTDLLDRALAMSSTSLKEFGLVAPLVVAPPSGFINPSALAALPPGVRLLLSSEVMAEPGPDPTAVPATLEVDGHKVRLADASASLGGPAPGNVRSSIQVRQRILAETALRALSGSEQPLVMEMPDNWNPGVFANDFVAGLDRSWLTLDPEPVVDVAQPTKLTAEELVYPDRIRERELGSALFDAADDVIAAGTTLQSVLSAETQIARDAAAQALTIASYASRNDPARAQANALGTIRSLNRPYRDISISAPPYVTLSSANGRFRVDLTNNLPQAITVRIEALTDSDLVIEAPARVRLKGSSSTSVLLHARSTQLGVHQVTLLVTDLEGTSLGPSDSLPIRANEVGRVIWVIIAGGAALLFGAIFVRLYRRFRNRGASLVEPVETTEPDATHDEA